ncbi:MAG: hypothetical protein A3E94_01860 [Candidatus Zambryskibacteria bacterium RIFCSPHIGHO2_12_FULL_44_12b]|uniref:Uncharacterized protein n=1 Tax=Candidatus Zambryskibacteria bacterium RIFCSPLOWO2_01_FULL_45_21 TaxID=1802761 RepID=A0A1G2U0R4_9BACT|nr:MAG: hypothetical protein A3E94_01860 [Candidatus Zambryskibacteria bacterium RIFCSPHIGHO2_12_FULL_44_12b]OHB03063.1 MAG: hypothetical protein A3B14_00155 [Candidatus Zambryskibacteria bacterium RIFCSPLOWO2_01_FULL_45_21]
MADDRTALKRLIREQLELKEWLQRISGKNMDAVVIARQKLAEIVEQTAELQSKLNLSQTGMLELIEEVRYGRRIGYE